MYNELKLCRIIAGYYESIDKRVQIRRHYSKQTGRRDEVCWSITIDNKTQTMNWSTLREAIVEAHRLMKERQDGTRT